MGASEWKPAAGGWMQTCSCPFYSQKIRPRTLQLLLVCLQNKMCEWTRGWRGLTSAAVKHQRFSMKNLNQEISVLLCWLKIFRFHFLLITSSYFHALKYSLRYYCCWQFAVLFWKTFHLHLLSFLSLLSPFTEFSRFSVPKPSSRFLPLLTFTRLPSAQLWPVRLDSSFMRPQVFSPLSEFASCFRRLYFFQTTSIQTSAETVRQR